MSEQTSVLEDANLNSPFADVACHPAASKDRGAGTRTPATYWANRDAPRVPHRALMDLVTHPDPDMDGVYLSCMREFKPRSGTVAATSAEV